MLIFAQLVDNRNFRNENRLRIYALKKMKVLAVIPYSPNESSMIFTKRQLSLLENSSLIEIRQFFLKSRTSLSVIIREAIRFRKEIADFEPDIVHAHYGTMTSFFCAMTTMKPLVITFRGSDLNPAPGDSRVRNSMGHLLSQLSVLRAARIICVSQQLKGRLWWKKEQVSLIPMGVNVTRFCPMSQENSRIALGWGLEEKIVLFNIGSDPVGKGLDLAKASVGIATKLIPGLRFVTLRGDVIPDKMPLYYNAANCLLMTSEYEGSPNIVKEALACNLPVVSVDVGDVRERVGGVYPSIIVPREPKMLGEALCQVLTSNLRSNGYYKIRELAEERIAEQVVKIYSSILH